MDPETSAGKTKSLKAPMSAYALRLPAWIKGRGGKKIAREDNTSLNLFVASAVAEKVAAIRTLNYFAPFGRRVNSRRIRPDHATENRRYAPARRRDAGGVSIALDSAFYSPKR